MKGLVVLLTICTLYFMTSSHVEAQVDPGNDPVMWQYVDPTQFWTIMIALVIVGGGFTIFFRRQKRAPKDTK
jgi:ABC-type arginine transport system permease subunit